MPDRAAQSERKPNILNNSTETEITFRPYGSHGPMPVSDGVMKSFSNDGLYIEATNKYKSGTILIVRVDRYPSLPTAVAETARPRSICLAEVKWQRKLDDENGVRFGMRLRYIY
ncbi:hypothetical protein [Desulfosarcina variabilis]|uniref:hypothetical protein n=1 Tax=Desulfosarcina variabilis TaxID=2300 RepID=UPI003AFAB7FD